MAETDIEWTRGADGRPGKSWNPTRGCSRCSPGCGGAAGEGGCYAERQAYRFSGPGMPYDGLVTLGKQGPRWTGVVRLVPEMLTQPLHWRKPARIFVDSMSDLFHESLTNEQIAAVFGVMAACPQHTFIVLTKRAKRMAEWYRHLPGAAPGSEWSRVLAAASGAAHYLAGERRAFDVVLEHGALRAMSEAYRDGVPMWPLPNVWVGVSCEDQERAQERIGHLIKVPAAVRFVSAEPLLGPLDLTFGVVAPNPVADVGETCPAISLLDWVIPGGESGPCARDCHIAWIRSLVEQCKTSGTPVFVKQLGKTPIVEPARPPTEEELAEHNKDRVRRRGINRDAKLGAIGRSLRLKHPKGGDPREWPEDLRMREWPIVKGATDGLL